MGSYNIRYYPIYRTLVSMMVWLPIFFLFFNAHLEIKDVLLLEAIYYISVVLLEVPSGYFSDLIGRKITLLISSFGFIVAYFIYGFWDANFLIFSVAQVFLAVGMSFMSGTNTAFYFESLKEEGMELEFPVREAKIQSYTRYGAAAAIILGGFIGSGHLRFSYIASLLFITPAFLITLGFKEPIKENSNENKSILRKFKNIGKYLGQAELKWLFIFSILIYVISHLPYELYQPYLTNLESSYNGLSMNAAILSGVLMALTSLIAGYVAGKSIDWSTKFGLKKICFLALGVQLVILGSMSFFLHVSILILILFRSCSMAIIAAPINSIIIPRIKRNIRATYFSFQSLISRLLFSITLTLLSLRVYTHELSNWSTLSVVLQTAFYGCVLVSILMLFLRSGELFKKSFTNF